MTLALAREDSGLAQLAGAARAPEQATWQAAVNQLALRSLAEPSAMQAWSELLLAESPELRLRGLYGLHNLAAARPVQVAAFLCDRFEEPETFADPVLSHWLVRLLGALPPAQQQPAWERLVGAGEAARCAAVGLLWERAGQEGSPLLSDWARDPSVRVRTGLALVLCERMPSTPAFEPLLRLARDPELEVRSAVALGMADLQTVAPAPARAALEASLEFRQLQQTLQAQPELVRFQLQAGAASGTRTNPLDQILLLTRDLEQRPGLALQELTPWVRLSGAWHRLKTVADFARDPQVAWAARALAQLCRDGDPVERVLGCLGALGEAGNNPVLDEFALMCRCCLELLECSNSVQLSGWGQRWQRSPLQRPELRWAELEQLAQALLEKEPGPGLDRLRDTSGMGPLPERELVEPALRHALELFQSEGEDKP